MYAWPQPWVGGLRGVGWVALRAVRLAVGSQEPADCLASKSPTPVWPLDRTRPACPPPLPMPHACRPACGLQTAPAASCPRVPAACSAAVAVLALETHVQQLLLRVLLSEAPPGLSGETPPPTSAPQGA